MSDLDVALSQAEGLLVHTERGTYVRIEDLRKAELQAKEARKDGEPLKLRSFDAAKVAAASDPDIAPHFADRPPLIGGSHNRRVGR